MVIDRRYSVSEGTAMKAPCRAATTANITLAGEQTIDGVAVVEHDRVLVKNQTDTVENGIYTASTGNWSRARDCDGAYDIVTGTLVRVTSGTNKAFWEVTTTGEILPGTTALAFASTSNALSGVSALILTLLDDTTQAEALATLGAMSATFVPDPVGTVKQYALSALPANSGWALCYGQPCTSALSAVLRAALIADGSPYGNNGTDPLLPDCNGRVIAGQDDAGGVSKNRLTGLSGGVNGDTLGATGGAESHALTEAEGPVHDHDTDEDPHSHPVLGSGVAASGYPYLAGANAAATSLTQTGTALTNLAVLPAGSGTAHNNVQPTIIMNMIIKL